MEQSLRDSILTLVKKREDEVKAGESDNYGSDFLGSLLRAHHDSDPKNRISEDNIIDECKVFYIAGHATISSLLSWTIVLLSNHTEWQDRARQEVLQLFGREKPTLEGIIRLKIVRKNNNNNHHHHNNMQHLLVSHFDFDDAAKHDN